MSNAKIRKVANQIAATSKLEDEIRRRLKDEHQFLEVRGGRVSKLVLSAILQPMIGQSRVWRNRELKRWLYIT